MRQRLAVLAAVALSAGCGSTVRVRDTNTGGNLTLVGSRGESLELAKPVMAAKCGGNHGYDIVQDTGSAAAPEDEGQWEITYACKAKAREAKPKTTAPPL